MTAVYSVGLNTVFCQALFKRGERMYNLTNVKKALERVLLQVQKPARYTGGEMGSVVKDASKVDVRFAFCFPRPV